MKLTPRNLLLTLFLFLAVTFSACAPAASPQPTTSTQDSGLLDVLVPLFQEQTGYTVQTVAVGTGAALKMELSFWAKTELEPAGLDWYIESGQGMGATLTIASEKQAYTLTDRATYLANKDNLDLEIIVEGNKTLLNAYHVITVNTEKWPNANYEGALASPTS